MGEPATALANAPAEVVDAPPSTALATTSARATIMRASIDADHEQRQLLAEYIRRNMVEGVDFGKIPGTDKPTLLKPGAEKLTDLFRVEPTYEVAHRIEDWDKPLFHYEFRVILKDRTTGTVYAEGFGSCNSREGRYRWRNGDRLCPECGASATIIKGKEEYGGGWLCWPRKGGCNAKFKDGDAAIEGQTPGKVENDDVFTLVNTILKMAKKRALVDAAIALARCSDIFTQDVEDMEGHGGGGDAPRRNTGRRQQRGGGQRDDGWQAPTDGDEVRGQHGVPVDSGVRRGRQSDRPPAANADPADYTFKSGRNEGKRLGDLSSQQLAWYAENAQAANLRDMARAVLNAREAADPMAEAGDMPEGWGGSATGE